MKPSAKEEGYRFVCYLPDGAGAIFENIEECKLERFVKNKNHASWGFSFNKTDWEFAESATYANCPHCLNDVFKSDLAEYSYVCYVCNENFYDYEVYE